MRVEDILKPVSADAPCGKDLFDADDADFTDYYFGVEDRLPTSYFNIAKGTLFDGGSIDHKSETAQIDVLLKRTRDLRLLGLEAKFQILTGRFKGFSDAVMAMAGLIETYPDEVHPIATNERRNALEELDALVTVVMPLDYATLITDKRIGDVKYRPYGTGVGKIEPRAEEARGDSNAISGALGSSENAKAVDLLYAQLVGLLAALKSVAAASQARAQSFLPRFPNLEAKLGDILEMVLAARGDLGGVAADDDAGGSGDAAAQGDGSGDSGPVSGKAATITINAPVGDVPDHKTAFRMLHAIEHYFSTTEPASLALVLVTQSRLLIGRPLVEALDALMENSAPYASITFGTDTGFAIPMARMRELSGQANIASTEGWIELSEDDVPVAEILSRDHAGMVLKQVEDFFRIREPASPIPILLFKARNMLSKDFHALVRELIPSSN